MLMNVHLPIMPLSLLSRVEVGLQSLVGTVVLAGGRVEHGLLAGGEAVLLVKVEHGLIRWVTAEPWVETRTLQFLVVMERLEP